MHQILGFLSPQYIFLTKLISLTHIMSQFTQSSIKHPEAQSNQQSKDNPLHTLIVQNQDNQPNCSLDKSYVKKREWTAREVKRIFILYAEFGSHWKLLQTEFAEHSESCLPRTSNQIKNKFYTMVRSFLKMLFREHPLISYKMPHEIPSATILRFYDGRQEFSRFKDFGRKILKEIDYNITPKSVNRITGLHSDQILELFETVFPEKIGIKTEHLLSVAPLSESQRKPLENMESQVKKNMSEISQSRRIAPSPEKKEDGTAVNIMMLPIGYFMMTLPTFPTLY